MIVATNTVDAKRCPWQLEGLEFDVLEKLEIEKLDSDIMKTLELPTVRDGYTNAAAILADSYNFKGVDVVRLGDSINKLMNRRIFESISAIVQLEGAVFAPTTFSNRSTAVRVLLSNSCQKKLFVKPSQTPSYIGPGMFLRTSRSACTLTALK